LLSLFFLRAKKGGFAALLRDLFSADVWAFFRHETDSTKSVRPGISFPKFERRNHAVELFWEDGRQGFAQ
jgi:hypothetical protein